MSENHGTDVQVVYRAVDIAGLNADEVAQKLNAAAKQGYRFGGLSQIGQLVFFEHVCYPCHGEPPPEDVHFHCNAEDCPHFSASVPDQLPDDWS